MNLKVKLDEFFTVNEARHGKAQATPELEKMRQRLHVLPAVSFSPQPTFQLSIIARCEEMQCKGPLQTVINVIKDIVNVS